MKNSRKFATVKISEALKLTAKKPISTRTDEKERRCTSTSRRPVSLPDASKRRSWNYLRKLGRSLTSAAK